MAITVEGTPTSAQGDGATATVSVPTVSGGILADDILVVAFCACESEDNTSNTPSGMDGEWISELQVGQTPPSVPGLQVFYEICSGGESGTRSTALSFTCGWMMTAFVLRGVDATTPLDVTPTTVQSTATGYPDPPSITPTNNDCMILAFGIKDETGADNLTSHPTNYTGIDWNNNNQSTGGTLMVAYRLLSGGGGSAEDPGIWSGDGGNDEWAAATIACRPGPTYSYEQEGFQFRLDDGSESGATDIGSQDGYISSNKGTNRRLRILSNATGNPPSHQVTIQFRKVGDPDSEWEDVD